MALFRLNLVFFVSFTCFLVFQKCTTRRLKTSLAGALKVHNLAPNRDGYFRIYHNCLVFLHNNQDRNKYHQELYRPTHRLLLHNHLDSYNRYTNICLSASQFDSPLTNINFEVWFLSKIRNYLVSSVTVHCRCTSRWNIRF